MQRELVLDTDKPMAEALARAFEAMIEEARRQVRRAETEPGEAMHDYRRALRRAEAVVVMTWPFMRREPRGWVASSLLHARRRTRVARDLDAVLSVVDKLRDLALLDGDPTLAAVGTWLAARHSEIASNEMVAWRLRKNVRALAGLGEIVGAAMHAWVDIEHTLESLRTSYREARLKSKKAAKSRRISDVHAFRRAVRRLRYQLELIASAKASNDGDVPGWLESVRDMHRTMKSLGREIGSITDLHALRDIVREAEDDVGFDADKLAAILSELAEGRIERVMSDAAGAFVTRPKDLFAAPDLPSELAPKSTAATPEAAEAAPASEPVDEDVNT